MISDSSSNLVGITRSSKRKVAMRFEEGPTDPVHLPNVIVMVGLPARGKTYISRKLCRYLKWIGFNTNVFNVGDYRRDMASDAAHGASASFFAPENQKALLVREESARRAMNDVGEFLESAAGNVADVKINSPDYKGLMTEDQAKDDFIKRINNYK
ncbi:putative 6-phosphofructo-2-kinase/fructose-2,6-bisphosphatase [Toxocara canis]|nr:putative 6-phosphofructo-2-kinase/fructose-2,6-bisphosphatase [Toxocara canis]